MWTALGLTADGASAAASVSLVFLGALLTALGVYGKIAKRAGTLVPVTGFANSVAAPAMEFRAKALVTGTAVKMFTIAGPVIVYGTAAGAGYRAVLVLMKTV